MIDFAAISSALTASLRLTRPPVAIRLTDSVPEGVALWSGSSPAGCRFWQEAMQRTFATAPRDHDLCAIGIHTHNLNRTESNQADLLSALQVFAALSYVRPEDVAQIPVLQQSPEYVVYGPLAESIARPDIVLLFVHAGQTLILSEAAQQLDRGLTPAMGRPACAVIPQAVNSGSAAISFGCCGARAYLEVLTDDVALFAIPGPKLEAFTARIDALAKANETLNQFHSIRKQQVASGKRPSVADSLAALSA